LAVPVTAKFGKFRVMLSTDGVTYAAPCGFTSKSLSLSKSLSEVSIPDCLDPDAPMTIARDIESISASISGDGVLAAESVLTWIDAYEDTGSTYVKVEIEFSTGTITWTGLMHLESIELGAEQGGRATISVSMQSDGALVRTDTL